MNYYLQLQLMKSPLYLLEVLHLLKRNCIPASDQSNAGGMQKDLVMLYKWPMKMQFFFHVRLILKFKNNYLLH